jgi:hypothetical protein
MAIADTPNGPMQMDPAVLSAVRTPDDVALRTAWQRYLEYSTASDKRKRTQEAVRELILVLTVLVVILAVISTYLGSERARLEVMVGLAPAAAALDASLAEAAGETQSLGDLCAVMRQATPADCLTSVNNLIELNKIILIALPLILAGMLTWMMQFMPGTAWIGYRIGAELVRYQLYLYRMQAGDYTGLSANAQQEQLLERVKQARRRVDQLGSSEPYTLPTPSDLAAAVKAKCHDPRDDGFSVLSVEEYLLYRIRPQREWYVKKLHRNYSDLRNWRAGVLLLTGLGAFLVAIGFEPWVAVTTAMATAAGIFIDLKMHGRTYAIYHTAVMELDEETARWLALPQEMKDEPAEISDFVKRIEDILQRERERWMQQAMQSQTASEQGLLRNVNLANSPFRVAEGINRDNDIPSSVPPAQSVRENAAQSAAQSSASRATATVAAVTVAIDPSPTPVTPMAPPAPAMPPAAPAAPARPPASPAPTQAAAPVRSAVTSAPRPATPAPGASSASPAPGVPAANNNTSPAPVPAVVGRAAAASVTPATRPAPPTPPELDVLPPSS